MVSPIMRCLRAQVIKSRGYGRGRMKMKCRLQAFGARACKKALNVEGIVMYYTGHNSFKYVSTCHNLLDGVGPRSVI